MNLSDYDIARITDQLAEKIHVHCECGLSTEARREMPHLLGMVKDIGEGEHSRGIEIMRDMGRRYSRMNRASEWIARVVLASLFVSFMSGVGWLIWSGVRNMIKAIR